MRHRLSFSGRSRLVGLTKHFVIVTLGLVLVATLVADFFLWEGRRDVDRKLGAGGATGAFAASAKISNLAFDDRTKSAAAILELEVKSRRKGQDIPSVTYGYQADANGETGDLINCTSKMPQCFKAYLDVPEPNGPSYSGVRIRDAQMAIALTEVRSEIWYPFDEFYFPLDLIGWVNGDTQNPDLVFERLVIRDSEPNYVLRTDANRYVLVRRPFIRIVSVVFFLLSVVFLWSLILVGDPKELLGKSLGFFGALWGLRLLLLPPSVTVFPTLVDYVILTEFCVLFMIIISRVPLSKGGLKTP